MRNIFSLTDIEHLKKSLKNASVANDCLMSFLNSYTFEDVYETEDESLVFQAGGKNDIEIEFYKQERRIQIRRVDGCKVLSDKRICSQKRIPLLL